MSTKFLHQDYVILLETILKNIKALHEVSGILLRKYAKNKKGGFGHIVQFLLYSSAEECGKFLIVKDLYPRKLSERTLRANGFNSHQKKWAKLLRYYAEQTGDLKNFAFYRTTANDASDFIRSKVREASFYVNYKNGKVIRPSFQSGKSFEKLAKASVSFARLCEWELKKFIKTPVFSG